MVVRTQYSGPICPNGGEFRISMQGNRTLVAWCTCLAAYFRKQNPIAPVPEFYWKMDPLGHCDINDSPRAIWNQHYIEVSERTHMRIKSMTVTYEDGSTQTWEGEGGVLPPTNAGAIKPGVPN